MEANSLASAESCAGTNERLCWGQFGGRSRTLSDSTVSRVTYLLGFFKIRPYPEGLSSSTPAASTMKRYEELNPMLLYELRRVFVTTTLDDPNEGEREPEREAASVSS
jgi:hypothetical protein